MTPIRHTLTKQERIVSLKLVEQLFGGGQSHSLTAFPLRAVYLLLQADAVSTPSRQGGPLSTVQMLVSVPKRRFKHAVDRNRVKRQVREAFRLHKQLLIRALPDGQRLAVAFIWQSDRHAPTADVESRVTNLMHRMAARISTPAES